MQTVFFWVKIIFVNSYREKEKNDNLKLPYLYMTDNRIKDFFLNKVGFYDIVKDRY